MSTRAVGSEASSSSSPDHATSWTGGAPDSLAAWLRAHGVDPGFASAANDTKSISELATEVRLGETTLEALPGGGAVRRVRVLRLLIRDDRDRVLIETRQEWSDGRVRERGTPLSEKMRRDEDWRDAARRAVLEELGSCLFLTKHATPTAVDADGGEDAASDADSETYRSVARLVTLDESSVAFSSITKSTSASYPGLRSAYDFVTVDARVRGLPECDETFVSGGEKNNDDAYAAEPAFTSTERDADGTTLVATWVWREGYVVDDGT